MGQPAAKQGDEIVAIDTHIVVLPAPAPPQQLPHLFSGALNGDLSPTVNIMSLPAATVGSTADNVPPHVPTSPGTALQNEPANKGTITTGSPTVFINSRMAARNGDAADTCNDPTDRPAGRVKATGTVFIG